jgi:hypothetical protein
MKRLLIIILFTAFFGATAATAAYAVRVPGKRDGDPDEVQSVKRNDEPSAVSTSPRSQGRLTQKGSRPAGKERAGRTSVQVRFPGRGFFLEK